MEAKEGKRHPSPPFLYTQTLAGLDRDGMEIVSVKEERQLFTFPTQSVFKPYVI